MQAKVFADGYLSSTIATATIELSPNADQYLQAKSAEERKTTSINASVGVIVGVVALAAVVLGIVFKSQDKLTQSLWLKRAKDSKMATTVRELKRKLSLKMKSAPEQLPKDVHVSVEPLPFSGFSESQVIGGSIVASSSFFDDQQ